MFKILHQEFIDFHFSSALLEIRIFFITYVLPMFGTRTALLERTRCAQSWGRKGCTSAWLDGPWNGLVQLVPFRIPSGGIFAPRSFIRSSTCGAAGGGTCAAILCLPIYRRDDSDGLEAPCPGAAVEICDMDYSFPSLPLGQLRVHMLPSPPDTPNQPRRSRPQLFFLCHSVQTLQDHGHPNRATQSAVCGRAAWTITWELIGI